eukprot:6201254-Pleurochrysis_carterae.AAC.2
MSIKAQSLGQEPRILVKRRQSRLEESGIREAVGEPDKWAAIVLLCACADTCTAFLPKNRMGSCLVHMRDGQQAYV